MAIILPLLLLLLVGLVDVARMANAMLTVQHAAREAVRAGIAGAGDSVVEQRALEASVPLDGARVTVNISPRGARTPGTALTVTVVYRHSLLLLLNGSDVTLQGQLTGRVE